MSDSAYNDALDYLYSFVDYSLTRNLRYSAEKFDLTRMEELMERMGNPHRRYPVIHVAGTKGKGSTAALIAGALQAAGYKVGFYTSPHLEEFNERIQVNRVEITNDELVRVVELLKPYAAAIERVTTFELTTAAGFVYFAEKQVDVAVVEVGLGGRLDATNVVDPLVSVITSLSLDHMAVLGDTLAKIAAEKAGIIKPGRPVVTAPQRDEARLVLERIANERGSSLEQVGRDVLFATHLHSLSGQSFFIWQKEEQSKADRFIEQPEQSDWRPLEFRIPLLGHHQVENAVTAYAALQAANRAGLKVSTEHILAGFARVKWPGRFEVVSEQPLVILDSAHNRDSALKLRLAIDDYLGERQVILVYGASEDKDVFGMLYELLPRMQQMIATESIHPRAMAAVKLVELSHQFGRRAQAVVPIEDALHTALELAGSGAAVVVTGSLFVAAAARQVLRGILGEKWTGYGENTHNGL